MSRETNDKEMKKSTYNAEVQKKYNQKVKYLHVKYTLQELEEYAKVEHVISSSGMSCNAFIKMVLKDYIDKLEEDRLGSAKFDEWE